MLRHFLLVAIINGCSTTSGGIDTAAGQNELPLAVQGNAGIDLVAPGATATQLQDDLTPPNVIIPGKVGIGTTIPQATFDTNGEVRVGNTGTTCSSTNEGALQYDKTNHVMKYCNGTGWTNMSTPPSTIFAFSAVGNLNNDGAAAYCNSNQYVMSGGGYCYDPSAALIWSAAFRNGDNIWPGIDATSDGWRADCTSPGGVIVPAIAFVVCAPK